MESGDADAVAERVGRRIAVQYVRRIELAKPNLTIASLVGIAAVLNCKVTTLFAKPRSMKVKQGRPRKTKR
jgi:transcriptional regulator with XRE-family HTH domain